MRSLIFIGACLLISSCSTKPVTKDELLAYVVDDSNGLTKSINQGDVTLNVTYRPNDLIVLQQVIGESFSNSEIDSVRKKFCSYDYFVLSISRNGQAISNAYLTDDVKYSKAIEYLSSIIGKDIHMKAGDEKILIEDFLYVRGFGASKGDAVLLAFKSNLGLRSGEFSIVFEDSFFNTHSNQFYFRIDDLRSVPSLNLIASAL